MWDPGRVGWEPNPPRSPGKLGWHVPSSPGWFSGCRFPAVAQLMDPASLCLRVEGRTGGGKGQALGRAHGRVRREGRAKETPSQRVVWGERGWRSVNQREGKAQTCHRGELSGSWGWGQSLLLSEKLALKPQRKQAFEKQISVHKRPVRKASTY